MRLTIQGVSALLFDGVFPPSLRWLYEVHPELAPLLPERLIDREKGFALFDILQRPEELQGWERPWFYEVFTGKDDLESAFSIDRFGSAEDESGRDLGHMSWWRREGGYRESDACNRLEGATDGFQVRSKPCKIAIEQRIDAQIVSFYDCAVLLLLPVLMLSPLLFLLMLLLLLLILLLLLFLLL